MMYFPKMKLKTDFPAESVQLSLKSPPISSRTLTLAWTIGCLFALMAFTCKVRVGQIMVLLNQAVAVPLTSNVGIVVTFLKGMLYREAFKTYGLVAFGSR